MQNSLPNNTKLLPLHCNVKIFHELHQRLMGTSRCSVERLTITVATIRIGKSRTLAGSAPCCESARNGCKRLEAIVSDNVARTLKAVASNDFAAFVISFMARF